MVGIGRDEGGPTGFDDYPVTQRVTRRQRQRVAAPKRLWIKLSRGGPGLGSEVGLVDQARLFERGPTHCGNGPTPTPTIKGGTKPCRKILIGTAFTASKASSKGRRHGISASRSPRSPD